MKISTFFSILYVVMIISLILFMIFLVFWLQAEATDCTENPLRYFKDKNLHISCNCYDENGMIINGLSDGVILKT